jgi:hypothetical protein
MHNDDVTPVRDAYLDRTTWKAWCPHCRVFHHYKAVGLQPAGCPEPTPDTETGVLLRPAGRFTPAVEYRHKREIISSAR